MDDVETLARWLRDAYCRLRGDYWRSQGKDVGSWDRCEPASCDDYHAVARELLTNPPAVLCVPSVVVGGRS